MTVVECEHPQLGGHLNQFASRLASEAWSDAFFASALASHPVETTMTLAASEGIVLDERLAREIAGSVPLSPAGPAPKSLRAETGVMYASSGNVACLTDEIGCGGVLSITAECFCWDSVTGGCSCFSLFGTPCLSC